MHTVPVDVGDKSLRAKIRIIFVKQHISPPKKQLTYQKNTRNHDFLPLTSHLSLLTSHFSPLTSHFSPLTSHFSLLTTLQSFKS